MRCFAILIYARGLAVAPSRGTRVVKGAGMRSQCVVLRRFESCPLHHSSMCSVAGAVS